MAGYQTIEALRPILHRGPVATPVVDAKLIRPKGPFISRQGKRTPNWLIAEIVQRRRAGEPINKIAAETGVSTPTVIKHTRHVQPPEGGWASPWTYRHREKREINVERVKRLRSYGFSWADLGEEYGVADSVIRERLGLRTRNRKPETAFDKARRRVARLMGVHASLMMHDDKRAGRAPEVLSRARMILFWVCRHRLGMSNREAGAALGGFHRDMVGYCVRRVDAAMTAAGLPANAPVARITRVLTDAEWPKASA